MKIFGHFSFYLLIIGLILCLASCEEKEENKDEIFDFPEEEIDIVAPDSSEIFIPDSSLIQELVASSNFDAVNDRASLVDTNNLVYILLEIAQSEKNSIEIYKAKNKLSSLSPDTMNCKKSILGDYYKYLSDQEEDWEVKVEHFKKAARYYEASYGSLNDHYLDMIYEVAVTYIFYLLDFGPSLKFIQRNVAIKELRRDNDIKMSNSYYVLGSATKSKAEYLKGLCYFKIAYKIKKDLSDKKQKYWHNYLNEEADYLYQLGEKVLAYECYDLIFSECEKELSLEDKILYHTNFAKHLMGDKNFGRASEEFDKVLELIQYSKANNDYSFESYFHYLLKAKKYDQLIIEYKAWVKKNKNIDKIHFFNFISSAYENKNDLDSALIYVDKAIDEMHIGSDMSLEFSFEKLKNMQFDEAIEVYRNKLRINYKIQAQNLQINELELTLKKYAILDSLFTYQLKNLDEESQLHLIDYYSKIFIEVLDGYFLLFNLGIEKKDEIFHFMERTKSVLLLQSQYGNRDQTNLYIKHEWQKIKSNYFNYDNYTELLKILNQKENGNFNSVKKYDIRDISRNTQDSFLRKNNKSLISYCAFENRLFGFSSDGTNIKFGRWYVDSLMQDSISELKRMLSKIQPEDSIHVISYEKLAYWFYTRFVNPMIFENSRNWLIIPGGPILNLPVEALVSKQNKSSTFSELNYLILDNTIHYAYSSKSINGNDSFIPDLSKRIILFGYSDKESISLKNSQGAMQELPGSIREIKSIESNFKNKSLVYKYMGKNCTKENFCNAIRVGKIIHCATHAISDLSTKRMSRLYFRNQNNTPDTSSWSLTPAEIAKMKIKADLVFLSACETGRGYIYQGEGTFNLGRAFLEAGAKNVIQSYWVLDDLSGSEIVSGFYDHLIHNSSCYEALRYSKLDYLNKWPNRAQPYFWCGFF